MRLNRNLFYIILLVFCVSVMIVIYADTTSVCSRIGTGLMTGSFLGLVSAFVNYMHQREEYFARFSMLCWEVAQALRKYQREATRYNKMLNESTKEQVVQSANNNYQREEEETEEMKALFEKFSHECKADLYVPFFFWNTYLKAFQDICEKIEFEYTILVTSRLMSRAFILLDGSNPKEIEEIVIGDPDEFYQSQCEACKDYADKLVSECYEYANLINRLCDKFFVMTQAKSTASMLDISARFATLQIEPDEEHKS